MNFLSEETAVNQTFYVLVFKRLIDAVRRKRGQLWRNHLLILGYDKAPANYSLRVLQFSAGKVVSAMDHTPYPSDFGFN
jgi:hypothetical protein